MRLPSTLRRHKRRTEGDKEQAARLLEERVSQQTLGQLVGTSDLPSGAPAEVAALLARYLAAEKGSISRALLRLEQQGLWRQEFGLVAEEEVPHELAAGKVLLQPPALQAPTDPTLGSSGDPQQASWQQTQQQQQEQVQQQNKPLVVVTLCKHLPGEDQAELERFIVLILDTASFYCWPPEEPGNDPYPAAASSAASSAPASSAPDPVQLAALFDLRGVTLANLQLASVKTLFSTLERHFPERLCALYLLDASWIFHSAWHLIEPFVDSSSRRKIRFLSGDEGRKTLVKEMGADVVPAEFGGRAAAVPIELALRRLPAWQQQQR